MAAQGRAGRRARLYYNKWRSGLNHNPAARRHSRRPPGAGEELLKRGASVDLPSSFGITTLMDAASYDCLSILLVLLQHSANPDLQDIDGVTALMKAADQGHVAPCCTSCSTPRRRSLPLARGRRRA